MKRMPSGPKASGPIDWKAGLPSFMSAVQWAACAPGASSPRVTRAKIISAAILFINAILSLRRGLIRIGLQDRVTLESSSHEWTLSRMLVIGQFRGAHPDTATRV